MASSSPVLSADAACEVTTVRQLLLGYKHKNSVHSWSSLEVLTTDSYTSILTNY